MKKALETEFPVEVMMSKYMSAWAKIDEKVEEKRSELLESVRSSRALLRDAEEENYQEGQWRMFNTQVIILGIPWD